ncbi:hypothetical protein [Sphingorhabdus sp. Alg239-R122]|uniref:hypothetical protein n=1 Tax=Sphingorhabdus sp. Alg239-R122 TaxID=2305989 RepID=UPI0013DC9255|nr:hypothetical protein [Sphingorhabdus sp. Alg239-R122]
MKRLILTLAALLCAPYTAIAAERVELSSDVYVEKISHDANGRKSVVLEKPLKVIPGDRLVFILKYRNVGDQAAENFVVTNPMPSAVAFQETIDGTELVSIDGGESWGRLKDLRVRMGGGYRNAVPEDVTHIRWNIINGISVGSQGKLTFRGVVR